MNPLLKYALGALFRHVITVLLTLIVVHHYIGADIASKLMHGDTVTLWQGYTLSVNSIVSYLLATLPLVVVPVLISIWGRIKSRFKFLAALQLPAATSEKKVDAMVSNTPTVEIIKSAATGTTN